MITQKPHQPHMRHAGSAHGKCARASIHPPPTRARAGEDELSHRIGVRTHPHVVHVPLPVELRRVDRAAAGRRGPARSTGSVRRGVPWSAADRPPATSSCAPRGQSCPRRPGTSPGNWRRSRRGRQLVPRLPVELATASSPLRLEVLAREPDAATAVEAETALTTSLGQQGSHPTGCQPSRSR
jgi:hypothetical protein